MTWKKSDKCLLLISQLSGPWCRFNPAHQAGESARREPGKTARKAGPYKDPLHWLLVSPMFAVCNHACKVNIYLGDTMSTALYDLIREMTADRFDDVGVESGPIKTMTFRPSAYTIHLVDSLAKELSISRQMMLDHIIDNGIRDAIDAYCDAHGTESDKAKEQFLDEVMKTWNLKREQE
jgi:hypothetical protein